MSKNLQVAITKLHDKVVAVTMVDDEHRIAEVLWQAPKPLSDEEIIELTKDSTIFEYREFDDDMVRFARAIEERHGIK